MPTGAKISRATGTPDLPLKCHCALPPQRTPDRNQHVPANGPLMCFMCLWFMWIWIKERSALAAVHSWVQSIYSRGAFGGKEQVTFIKYHLFMHILNIGFLRAKINVNRQCSMQIVSLSLIVCVSHCCCHISSHVSILALEMAVSVGWLVDPLSRLQTFGLVFQRES